MQALIQTFRANPELAIFLTLALGFWLGILAIIFNWKTRAVDEPPQKHERWEANTSYFAKLANKHNENTLMKTICLLTRADEVAVESAK